MKINKSTAMLIDKNAVNNTKYVVHEAQSFDDVTVNVLL